ncbi:MAG TPA: hypothetical protein VEJ63_23925, partial [Planctomycetota bacterium]|nr:hypothetical protein [Planctomycetota bacterium]
FEAIEYVAATAIFFGASQIAGAVIILTTSMSPARAGSVREHSTSAWLVAFGTVIGLLLPVMGPFLIFFQMREETAITIRHGGSTSRGRRRSIHEPPTRARRPFR